MTNTETDQQLPTLGRLVRRTLGTFAGAVENRAELFALEFEEENDRLLKMIIFAMSAVFLGILGLFLLTGTVIFLMPAQDRVYAAIGFAVIYIGGAGAAVLAIKNLCKKAPFAESLGQLKKDSELLDAFK